MAKTLAEIHDDFEEMSFPERLNLLKGCKNFTDSFFSDSMKYDGYICKDESQCVSMGNGKYYVYVWKHNYGDFFYAGMGQGDRWKIINPRCNEFYEHLDKADAVVFKVLSGLDEKTARRCENYISVNLARAGYTLANHDVHFGVFSEDLDVGVKGVVEEVICGILNKEHPEEHRKTTKFLEQYGSHFFSKKYTQAI